MHRARAFFFVCAGLLCLALVVVCGLMAMVAMASADIPAPPNSTVPAFIDVVGTAGGVPDSRGLITIVVRDQDNRPIPGGPSCHVTLDFSACTDMRLCRAQPYGGTVDCPTMTLDGVPDGDGQIRFIVVGAATNESTPVPGPGLNCVTIMACGVVIGHATAVVYDENGAAATASPQDAGVEVTDFRSLQKDWGSGIYYGRSDFTNTGPPLDPLDFRPWLRCWGDGTSISGCTTSFCP